MRCQTVGTVCATRLGMETHKQYAVAGMSASGQYFTIVDIFDSYESAKLEAKRLGDLGLNSMDGVTFDQSSSSLFEHVV